MSRRDLKIEYAKLEEMRPGIGGPITMVSIGGGLVVYGGFSLFTSAAAFGGLGGVFRSGNIVGYLYVTMLCLGAGLLVPGIWLWWSRREERAVMGDRMDEITSQLDKMERDRDERRRDAPPEQRERPTEPPADYPL
jgi:hypothetical protein